MTRGSNLGQSNGMFSEIIGLEVYYCKNKLNFFNGKTGAFGVTEISDDKIDPKFEFYDSSYS